jgi:DNA polymerase-3 subunit gamma/tau
MKLFKGDLDESWSKIIAMLELPSTKMLLSEQGKLLSIEKEGILFWKKCTIEVAISSKWINMIQSRKCLIEEACRRAIGIRRVEVKLIEQQ